LALAEHRGMSGREVIDALVLGIDVACRLGNLVYPEHYDRGWHITGTTGMLGAAAGCARLLKLDAQQTQMALGIAAAQPIGPRGGRRCSPPRASRRARARWKHHAAGRKSCRPRRPGTKQPTNWASASRS